jgi:hypothetical protein
LILFDKGVLPPKLGQLRFIQLKFLNTFALLGLPSLLEVTKLSGACELILAIDSTFFLSDSFRDSSAARLCSIFNHFPKVMKPSNSCALTLAAFSTLSLSNLLLRLDLDLHSPARLEILDPTLDEVRTKVQLLSLLDALYAEVLDCTRCRNLLA